MVEVDLRTPGVTPRVDLAIGGAAVVISRHHSVINEISCCLVTMLLKEIRSDISRI